MHMKKKKILEADLGKLDGMIFSLEQQVLTVESGSVNYDVVNAMKEGAAAQKKINESVDVDQTAELMDDIRDMQDDMNEVGDLLGQPADDILMDDDLLAEFDALEMEDTKEDEVNKLPEVPETEEPSKVVTDLPDAPNHEVKIEKKNEGLSEDEIALKQLEAEMAN